MRLLLLVLVPAMVIAAESATSLARSLQNAGLDPQACFRVRDFPFQKEDLRFYLTNGHLIFANPVSGRRFAALFTTEVPGGDAELIVFPPTASERASLASFTKSPNLNEHFNSAIFLFSDDTGNLLYERLKAASTDIDGETGASLRDSLGPILRNFTSSFESRLVQDLFTDDLKENGLFYAGVTGRTLGNIDLLCDLRAREPIVVGQVVSREDRSFFNTWTRFAARSSRNSPPKPRPPFAEIPTITIDATFAPDLSLRVTTKYRFPAFYSGGRAIGFDLSRRMSITGATFDEAPVEIFKRDSLRANLVRGSENDVFLVILPEGVDRTKPHTIEFHHEGNVVDSLGNGVYFVAARNSWYPNSDLTFGRYDLTFRHPKATTLVAAGDVVEDRTEGDVRTTRRISPVPIRFAGFNLGNFESVSVSRGGVSVQVYANVKVEKALERGATDVVMVDPSMPRIRRGPQFMSVPTPARQPNPAARLNELAGEIASAMEFMAGHFGPPPLTKISVSPIPGRFGQGFPGLIYLSTLAYLDAADRPPGIRSEMQQLFFSELLHAHETAHQWWGNAVTVEDIRDEWIIEGLANYSSLLYLEKKKGREAIELVLNNYRTNLLTKLEDGRTVDSVGPIVWGARLNTSGSPNAWQNIQYGKGSWIMHMLRRRMGDEQFLKMLGQLATKYKQQSITTEIFRDLAAGFVPASAPQDKNLENFFEQWVYGTGIPTLKLQHSVTGKGPRVRVRGTITQSGVSDDFSTWVPVTVRFSGKQAPVVRWVKTSSEGATFTIDVPRAPSRVTLNEDLAVLAVKN